jgi:hypothetical protein
MKERRDIRRRAAYLLQELAEELQTIDDTQLRIKVQIQVADLLWGSNRDRARKLFEGAFRDADAALDEKNPRGQTARAQLDDPRVQLRNNVLAAISRRDPILAKRLVSSLPDSEIMANQSERAVLYLQMAMSLIDSDPSRAVELITSSIETSGLSLSLAGVLHELRHKSPTLADQAFVRALSVARRDMSKSLLNVRILAGYALPGYEGKEIDGVAGANALDDRTIHQFLEFAYEAITRWVPSQTEGPVSRYPFIANRPAFEYQTVNKLIPFFEQYLPDKSNAVRMQLDQMARALYPQGTPAPGSSDQSERVQYLVDRAERMQTSAQRDMLYLQAAMMASRLEDTAQALSISMKISNEEQRSVSDSIIHYQAAIRANSKRDIETAYQHAREIGDPGQLALALGQIVKVLRNKDKTRAYEILDEAIQRIEKREESPAKAHALHVIAEVAVELDLNRGFEAMESVVYAINHIDWIARSDSSKRAADPGHEIDLMSLVDFNKTLSVLAASDFERALGLAQRIGARGYSMLAQLAVCRSVLNKKPGSSGNGEVRGKQKKVSSPPQAPGSQIKLQ